MELILLGHLLGDFYVQTDKISEKKRYSFKYMLLHCCLYTFVMFLVFVLLTEKIIYGLAIATIIGLLHMIVDLIKVKCDSKYSGYVGIIFIIDQSIHIAVLIFAYIFIKFYFNMNTYSSLELVQDVSVQKIIAVATAVLVCWKPMGIIISIVFNTFFGISDEDEVKKVGYFIGVLEREIIFILGLLGQYGAIGFVLTAKSLARYKQLEEKNFAEKYLVGTLISALAAIVCVAVCSFVK